MKFLIVRLMNKEFNNNMSSPTFYNAKPIGLMSYQIGLFKISQMQRVYNYESIPGLSK